MLRSVFTVLVMFAAIAAYPQDKSTRFDKALFYKAMEKGTLEDIENQLELTQKSGLTDKSAFEGGLLMKKAGKVSKPGEKLRLFKSGRNKLEPLIKKFPENVEYRFIRLMIQENAPDILGYNKDFKTDKEVIKKFFNTLSPVVKEAVENYSRISKILTPADL